VSLLSASFALFLALGLLGFYLAPARARPAVLLGLSLLFYCTWNPEHALLLVATTAVVQRAALWIQRSAESARLRLTTLVVTGLLVVLVAFKCALTVAASIDADWVAGNADAAIWLAAPLGLSYYLFKLIGYLLDVYWEKLPARQDFVSVALYAAFFPQIVSGPIQRADDFFTQLDHPGAPDPTTSVTALRRILFGLFKKMVVADQLAVIVVSAHTHPEAHSSIELLVGAYCFSLQMYADFSGVTDIALGVGMLFGIQGPENFNRPYFARNLQEFWRRWHMSLTTWLTDYLFMPLRMAFRNLGNLGLALAIFINMVAIGVWHGPRWTYLVFGCLNGVFLIVSVLTLKRRNTFFRNHPGLAKARPVFATLITFHLVVATHVFFQAPDLHSALSYLGQMFHVLPHAAIPAMRLSWSSFGLTMSRLLLALVGLVVVETVNYGVAFRRDWVDRFLAGRREMRWAVYYAAAILVVLSAKGTTSFIYAKF
jgi:alginate O-acetyltransferase complex protein AlgI